MRLARAQGGAISFRSETIHPDVRGCGGQVDQCPQGCTGQDRAHGEECSGLGTGVFQENGGAEPWFRGTYIATGSPPKLPNMRQAVGNSFGGMESKMSEVGRTAIRMGKEQHSHGNALWLILHAGKANNLNPFI